MADAIDAFLDEPEGDEIDAFLDAPDEGPSRLDQALAEPQDAPIGTAVLSAAETVPFATKLASGMRAAVEEGEQALTDIGIREPSFEYASREIQGQEQPSFLERYRTNRDADQAAIAQLQQDNPVASGVGTVAGIAGQIAALDPRAAVAGVRALPALIRGAPAAGRALLTREGVAGAGRALLTRETAKQAGGAAATGATFGGLTALDTSEADLTRGEFGQAAEDTLSGATSGAVVGLAGRLIPKAVQGAVAGRAAGQLARAKTAGGVEAFDKATEALPEQKIAAKAVTKAEKARVAADTAAAREEAKAATVAKKAAAKQAARAERLSKPLVRTGLEGKQQSLGGELRAKARGEALINEPSPNNPQAKLVDELDALQPPERLERVQGLRRETGAKLGAIREELAQVEGAAVTGAELKQGFRSQISDLPTEVQEAAIQRVDAMIDAATLDGLVAPRQLRKLAKDAQALSDFDVPDLNLGRSQKSVFRRAYDSFTENEKYLIDAALPKARAEEYGETLRRHGVYRDLEKGSKVFLGKFNKGLPTISVPRVTVERVQPRAVRPAQIQPEPQAPQYPGGEEALARDRRLLRPSLPARATGALLKYGGGGAGAALGGIGGPAGAWAGGAGGQALGQRAQERWLQWLSPSSETYRKSGQALERLGPLMEQAIEDGPRAVAQLHAQLMAKSPQYRALVAETP